MSVLRWFVLVSFLVGCDDGGGDAAADAGKQSDGAVAADVGLADAAATDAALPDAALDESTQPLEIVVGDFVFDAIGAGPADGTPVLLLHGFPQTKHSFRRQVEALGAAGYRAIAPDQRGYSPRARPPEIEDYTLPLLSQDVLDMADALGFGDFHVVGHDWGAAVVWYLAGTQPDRLLSINPISVPHLDAFAQALLDPDSDQAQRSGYVAFFRGATSQDTLLANDAAFLRNQVWTGLDEADMEAHLEVLGTPEALGAALNWYRANEFDTPPMLGPIEMPTMFVWGDMDAALGPDGANATGDFVVGPYRFEVLQGATHWIPELNADRLIELLLDHLGG